MAATWTVIRQAADQVSIQPNGDPVSGVQVFFQTGVGNQGSIFVPDAQYQAETVQAMVQVMADKMDAVSALTSG